MMRGRLVVLHRWAGLVTAGFLLVAGLTGSLLAFEHELETVLNPHLFVAPSEGTAPALLDPFELRERAQRHVPQAAIDQVVFRTLPGHSVVFWLTPRIDPATGKPFELAADQLFVDPATGEKLGQRKWGELISGGSINPENLLPFLLRVHYALALPDPWGTWLFGGIALVWTLDCFVGLALTLPRLRRAQRPFLTRWKPSWLIKWRGGAYRVNLDLHRALGLWLWVMLLIYAWSSVMLNLRQEVYKPVMSLAFAFSEDHGSKATQGPALDWQAARTIARSEMNRLAAERGFTINYEDSLWLDRKRGIYTYRAHTSLDVYDSARGVGKSKVVIDAATGAYRGASLPSGDASGDTVSNWLQALHMARVFGLPLRIFACALGLIVAMLSVTGVVIWVKKRHGQAHRADRKVTGSGANPSLRDAKDV